MHDTHMLRLPESSYERQHDRTSNALTSEQLLDCANDCHRSPLTIWSGFYRLTYERCVLQPKRLPSAVRMQELITGLETASDEEEVSNGVRIETHVPGGESGRNRTFNLVIKSHLLCQLSYAP